MGCLAFDAMDDGAGFGNPFHHKYSPLCLSHLLREVERELRYCVNFHQGNHSNGDRLESQVESIVPFLEIYPEGSACYDTDD